MKKQNLMMLALMGMSLGVAMQAGAQGMKDSESDCSNLSPAEQSFASELSDENRKVFCNKFSAGQRKSAMMLSCNGPGRCGTPAERSKKQEMTPDDSVQKIMQKNNISMSDKREELSE